MLLGVVDVTFDCREDARGRDPDSHSPTLRRDHQLLWSKRLPCAKVFHLEISGPKPFLVHRSELGEFHLTSDSITHRYSARATIKPLVERLPNQERTFVESETWPVSECIVFPGKRVNGKNTLNGERRMSRRIGDRFDLTLECIRRHYRGEQSPISDVLDRYSTFFSLFESFRGYVDFFLLKDLTRGDYEEVEFYLPFDDFRDDPLPRDLESYVSYLRAVETFANRRAQRIVKWCRDNASASE